MVLMFRFHNEEYLLLIFPGLLQTNLMQDSIFHL